MEEDATLWYRELRKQALEGSVQFAVGAVVVAPVAQLSAIRIEVVACVSLAALSRMLGSAHACGRGAGRETTPSASGRARDFWRSTGKGGGAVSLVVTTDGGGGGGGDATLAAAADAAVPRVVMERCALDRAAAAGRTAPAAAADASPWRAYVRVRADAGAEFTGGIPEEYGGCAGGASTAPVVTRGEDCASPRRHEGERSSSCGGVLWPELGTA